MRVCQFRHFGTEVRSGQRAAMWKGLLYYSTGVLAPVKPRGEEEERRGRELFPGTLFGVRRMKFAILVLLSAKRGIIRQRTWDDAGIRGREIAQSASGERWAVADAGARLEQRDRNHHAGGLPAGAIETGGESGQVDEDD